MNPLDHAQLNAAVNTVAGNHPTHPYFQRQTAVTAATNQIKYIREEVEELLSGIREDNLTEIRDGLGDSIVTLDGLMHRLGLRYHGLRESQVLVHSSMQSDAELEWTDVLNGALTELVGAVGELADTQDMEETLFSIRVCGSWLLAVLYEVAKVYDIDVMADQQEIYRSNMTKFDTDNITAMLGKERYQAQMGIEVVIVASEYEGQAYYILKSPRDQQDHRGRLVPAGKFLKSINFEEPRLV